MSKGIWKLRSEATPTPRGTKLEYKIVDDASDDHIAQAFNREDARLIAAAPELFDTLHEAVDFLQAPFTMDPDERKARQAVLDKFLNKAYEVLYKVED